MKSKTYIRKRTKRPFNYLFRVYHLDQAGNLAGTRIGVQGWWQCHNADEAKEEARKLYESYPNTRRWIIVTSHTGKEIINYSNKAK